MASSYASFLLLSATILLAVNTASGITCYSCDSSKGVSCNYGLLSLAFPTQDCNAASDSSILGAIQSRVPMNCIKLVGVDKDGNEYVARSCGLSTGPLNNCQIIAKTMEFGQSTNLEKLDCWTCDTDRCNSAGKMSAMALLGLICACFVFLF